MKITLGKLEKSAQDLSDFLGEKLGVEVTVNGGEIDIEAQANNVKNSQVKTYLKRYLYLRGFKGKYRASAERGSLNILALKNPEEEEIKSELPKSKKKEQELKQTENSITEEKPTKTEEKPTKTEEKPTKTEETEPTAKKNGSRKNSAPPDSDK